MITACIAQFEVDLHHVGVSLYSALSDRVVISGALVHVLECLRALLDRLELDNGHCNVKLHNLGLTEAAMFFIPFSTFEVQTVNICTVLGALTVAKLGKLLLLGHEIELQFINRRRVLLS